MPANVNIEEPVAAIINPTAASKNDVCARLFDLINTSSELTEPEQLDAIIYPKGSDNFVYDWVNIEKRSNYALNLVDSTNTLLFDYLAGQELQAKQTELLMAYYYIYAQWELHRLYGRRYKLAAYEDYLKRCANQIKRLNLLLNVTKPSPSPEFLTHVLDEAADPIEGHSQYLGIDLALWIRDTIYEFMHGNVTITLKSLIGMINERRLYWVWAGGIISALLNVIPQSLKGLEHAQKSLANIGQVTGYMSFIIYYLRFSIDLLMVTSHVIENQWMTQEELGLEASAWDKLVYHAKQRGFSLLNDGIWATANLLCFMVLVGNQVKENANNFLTLGLLVMDVGLLFWQYQVESNRHADYIALLDLERDEVLERLNNDPDNPDYRAEKNRLDQMISDAEFEWKYKRLQMINDLGYAISLMFAFSILCVYGYPQSTMLILGVVGAALCFSLNLFNVVIRGCLDIQKTHETKAMALKRVESLTQDLVNAADDLNKQKQIYLLIKEQQATTNHQRRQIQYQQIDLIRSVIFDVIFPSTVMVSLLFLPTGAGIGVIAAVVVLALLSNLIMTQIIKPRILGSEQETELQFNEIEFEDFREQHALAAPQSTLVTVGAFSFFCQTGNDSEEEGLDDDCQDIQLD